MLLIAVDIGNTNVVLGFIHDGRIAGTYRITTKANHTSDEYGLMITQFLKLSGFAPGDHLLRGAEGHAFVPREHREVP